MTNKEILQRLAEIHIAITRLYGELDALSSENYLKIIVDNTKTTPAENDNKVISFPNPHK